MKSEQIIKSINRELNQIYSFIDSVSIVICPDEELEEILDDLCRIRSKLSVYYRVD